MKASIRIRHLPALGGEMVSCAGDGCVARTYRPTQTGAAWSLQGLFAIEMMAVRLILCREHLGEMYHAIVGALAEVPSVLLSQVSDAELALIFEHHQRYAPSGSAPDDPSDEAWHQYDDELRAEHAKRARIRSMDRGEWKDPTWALGRSLLDGKPILMRREASGNRVEKPLPADISTRGSIHEGCGGTWEAPPGEEGSGIAGLIDRCTKCGEERA